MSHVRQELGDRGFAMLSTSKSVRSAVVFLHGFNGDPETTWFQFQTLIDSHGVSSWWSDCDLFFYKYDSVFRAININVFFFSEFLETFFPTPPASLFKKRCDSSQPFTLLGLNEDVAMREGFSGYTELVLVGHSAGAVIARAAIRDYAFQIRDTLRKALSEIRLGVAAGESPSGEGTGLGVPVPRIDEKAVMKVAYEKLLAENPKYRVLDSRLCLFAPAHCGSSISGGLGVLLETPGFSQIIRPNLRWSAAIADLEPQSPVITSLRTDIDSLADYYDWIRALRARILWGENEKIVFVDKFRNDTPKVAEKQDHVSVCKPTLKYMDPIKFVSET
jgi:pimeloyl-ACP methyl ester carboxylesterase